MKKKKIILHAIGNEGNFNFYIFDKKTEIYYSLSKILQGQFDVYLEPYDDNNKKLQIEKYHDVHQSTHGHTKRPRVDIFYGNKKMFLAIHCSEKQRAKFNEELFKLAIMPKVKPIKTSKKKGRK